MGLELAGQIGSVSIEKPLLGKYTWQFDFFKKNNERKKKITFPHRESNPGHGGESAGS